MDHQGNPIAQNEEQAQAQGPGGHVVPANHLPNQAGQGANQQADPQPQHGPNFQGLAAALPANLQNFGQAQNQQVFYGQVHHQAQPFQLNHHQQPPQHYQQGALHQQNGNQNQQQGVQPAGNNHQPPPNFAPNHPPPLQQYQMQQQQGFNQIGQARPRTMWTVTGKDIPGRSHARPTELVPDADEDAFATRAPAVINANTTGRFLEEHCPQLHSMDHNKVLSFLQILREVVRPAGQTQSAGTRISETGRECIKEKLEELGYNNPTRQQLDNMNDQQLSDIFRTILTTQSTSEAQIWISSVHRNVNSVNMYESIKAYNKEFSLMASIVNGAISQREIIRIYLHNLHIESKASSIKNYYLFNELSIGQIQLSLKLCYKTTANLATVVSIETHNSTDELNRNTSSNTHSRSVNVMIPNLSQGINAHQSSRHESRGRSRDRDQDRNSRRDNFSQSFLRSTSRSRERSQDRSRNSNNRNSNSYYDNSHRSNSRYSRAYSPHNSNSFAHSTRDSRHVNTLNTRDRGRNSSNSRPGSQSRSNSPYHGNDRYNNNRRGMSRVAFDNTLTYSRSPTPPNTTRYGPSSTNPSSQPSQRQPNGHGGNRKGGYNRASSNSRDRNSNSNRRSTSPFRPPTHVNAMHQQQQQHQSYPKSFEGHPSFAPQSNLANATRAGQRSYDDTDNRDQGRRDYH